MSKLWSLVFAAVNLGCLLLFIVSPFIPWLWLPKQASAHAASIDNLFYVILWITGFFFVLTEALLCVFMFRYAGEPGQKRVPAPAAPAGSPPPGGLFAKVKDIIHDEHRLEMLWTIVPAVILLYIAFAQVAAWAEVKYQARMPRYGANSTAENKTPMQVEVTARQWEWRMRYPSPRTLDDWMKHPTEAGKWVKNPHYDDLHLVNEVHTWLNQPTLIQLKTADIIHSFFLPQMRVKQDALPGKTIPVWFTPILYNCKPHLEYTDSETKSPDEKKPWRRYGKHDLKDGAKKYAWVSHWKDGYDPNTPEGKEFKDHSQIWELNCAELCGAFHYRMIGRVYVHETSEDFRAWLEMAYERQNYYGAPTK